MFDHMNAEYTIGEGVFIHEFANVQGPVHIGSGTRIWQFASVIRGTVLGEDCNVAHGACLDGPKFGNRCIISHNVAMGPGFEVGDDTFIGPQVTFCNDMWPTTNKEGWDLKQFQEGFVTVLIGKNCFIGANAVILPGVVLYDNSGVAAGAVCGVNVPSGCYYGRDNELHKIPEDAAKRRMRRVNW